MGITVARNCCEEVGGEGAKAVQVGGASGQCVPAAQFERTIAYEDIPTGGSIIVFGPQRDMLDVAGNFLEFFVDKSCGQCTPCREGVPKLLEGVDLLQAGQVLDGLPQGALRRWARPCSWPPSAVWGSRPPMRSCPLWPFPATKSSAVRCDATASGT